MLVEGEQQQQLLLLVVAVAVAEGLAVVVVVVAAEAVGESSSDSGLEARLPCSSVAGLASFALALRRCLRLKLAKIPSEVICEIICKFLSK